MTSTWTRSNAGAHVVVLVGFVALAVRLTWPLLPSLTTHLPGSALDDNAGFLWDFWLFRRALADPSQGLLATTAAFHPDGINLALHTHLLLSAVLGGTILGWASLPVALNLTLLAACTLNGFSTYLLAWRLTATRRAAIVAGVFFAAAPLFVVHFFGHFNRYAAWPLVFFVRACLIAFERPSMRTSLLAGVWLAAVAYNDYYYFVYAAVFAFTALLCRWLSVDLTSRTAPWTRTDTVLIAMAAVAASVALLIHVSGGLVWTTGSLRLSLRSGTNVRAVAAGLLVWWLWRRRRWTPVAALPAPATFVAHPWPAFALMLATWLLLMAPLLTHALAMWLAGQYVTQSYVWRNAPPGIDAGALLTGNVFNNWWGSAVSRIYTARGIDGLAPQLWLGLVPLLLFFTRRWWMADRAARTWVLYGSVFFVWAVGPFLRILGVDTGLPLPQILMRYVPIVSNARLPPHAGVMVYLAVAMLLSCAVAKWPVPRRHLAALAIVGLILLDFNAAPRPLVPLERSPVVERLAQRPAGAVLDVPTGIRDGFGPEGGFDAASLYYQTIHGKPIVTGYVSRLPPAVRQRYHDSPAMRALFAVSIGEPAPPGAADPATAATELASRWQVRYIVVDQRSARPEAQRFIEATGAALIDRDAFKRLYVLPAGNSR